MASTSLPLDSVYEEEKCIVKSGKDRQTTGAGKTLSYTDIGGSSVI